MVVVGRRLDVFADGESLGGAIRQDLGPGALAKPVDAVVDGFGLDVRVIEWINQDTAAMASWLVLARHGVLDDGKVKVHVEEEVPRSQTKCECKRQCCTCNAIIISSRKGRSVLDANWFQGTVHFVRKTLVEIMTLRTYILSEF
jgi:P2-related tail formation protein